MTCDRDRLQQYLDFELDAEGTRELERHLGGCRACRQELARLRLLWLELEEPESVEVPSALPYLRQQAVAEFVRAQEQPVQPGMTFRESMELVWVPAFRWASFMPGIGLHPRTDRRASTGTASEGISVWSVGRRIWQLTRRGRKDKK
ncbi:MAG: zf-HC2 domain-containing protein [Firmicutes bacterium]|nr:zf-HC2 domain-containing protein [Bacillota bacterium]